MMKYLPKLEIRVYFLCHILFILYSIYTVFTYRAGKCCHLLIPR